MYMYLLPTFDSFKKFFTESWQNATIITLPHDTGKKIRQNPYVLLSTKMLNKLLLILFFSFKVD